MLPVHTPVLKNEVLSMLSSKKGDWILDATLGFGGHAKAILDEIGEQGLLVAIDQDEEVIEIAKKNLEDSENVLFYHTNFENLESVTASVRRKARMNGRKFSGFDGILFDLGMSSLHVDDSERGFSFLREGPLDMRFDRRNTITAYHIINQWSYDKLIRIFTVYGEESRRFSERITQAILQARRKRPFRTTLELANLVLSLFPRALSKVRHPATRIFQALRIAINRELEVLEKALLAAVKAVCCEGKIVVISFHSLEDRIVKNLFREYANRSEKPVLTLLTKQPITPTEEEIRENPRSRSAKLRAAKRIL